MVLMEKWFTTQNYAAHKLLATKLYKMSGVNIFMKMVYSENNVDIFKA